jgi:hypothetical protein
MPVHNLRVGGALGMDWLSRATGPRTSEPMLILRPPDDRAFVAASRAAVGIGTTPSQLERALRATYPHAVVRRRELIGERFTIWYVYRDGHWVPPGTRSPEEE